jgi:hypothetical protein
MTETSLRALPRVVTRVFSPKSATAEEWQAFHSYIRLGAAEEDPGEPVLDDAVRQRDMQTDWPLFEAHRVLALIDGEIVGSLVMWTRRQGTPDYEAHARHISADAGVRKSRRRQGRPSAAAPAADPRRQPWRHSRPLARAVRPRSPADLPYRL